jgi:glycosyltransferase involved in cell wall biosynthesis
VTIEAFVTCWNEEKNINQYLDWYQPFVDSVTVMDNHSTDRSVELAKERGCKVVEWGVNEYDNLALTAVKEECWKNSDADWVIVGDMDELLYHPNLRKLLEDTEFTIIQSDGYIMVSEEYIPWKEVKFGVKEAGSKIICFRPRSIVRMNWKPGCHSCSPEGDVRKFITPEVKLLHFFLIGHEEFKEKWKRYRSRECENDKRLGLGYHYFMTDKEMENLFDGYIKQAVNVW